MASDNLDTIDDSQGFTLPQNLTANGDGSSDNHGHQIHNVGDPTSDQDVSTKAYTDARFKKLIPVTTQTTNYTASANDFVPVNTTSGSLTVTLPTAPTNGTLVAVKMTVQGSTNTTSVVTGGSDVFNKAGGGTTLTLTLLNQALLVEYYSGVWYVLADDLPLGQLDTRYQTYDPTNAIAYQDTDTTITAALNRVDGFFSGPGLSNIFGTSFTAFRAAWSKRATARVNILGVGDSVTSGWLASNYQTRWWNVMMAYLQQANGQTVSDGYMPASLDTTGTGYTGGLFSTTGTVTTRVDGGLGYNTMSLASGATATITRVCDRITVHYPHLATFSGSLVITIDGGASVTKTENDSPLKGGLIYDSGQLTRGSHTVVFSTTGGFGTRVEGVTFYDGNFSSGVVGYNGGHFGYSTANFTATAGINTPWCDGLDNLAPHLVIIALGINDQTAAVGASTYRTNLTGIITKINTQMTTNGQTLPSYLIVAPYGTGANSTATTPYRQAAIRAAKDNGAAWCDWSALVGYVGNGPSDTYSLMGDTKHPNTNGHRLLGNWMAQFLLNTLGYDSTVATGVNYPPTLVTTTYSALVTDQIILANSAGGIFTITLPSAVGIIGKSFIIKRTSASNTVTIATTSSQTIDGSTTATLASQYATLSIVSDGANWQKISGI